MAKLCTLGCQVGGTIPAHREEYIVKKRNDCTNCIAYSNILYDGSVARDDLCGLGFEIQEELTPRGKVVCHPVGGKCVEKIPGSKEEFVRAAKTLGIEWKIEDVVDLNDFYLTFRRGKRFSHPGVRRIVTKEFYNE